MTQPFDSIHCVQIDQQKRIDAIQSVWGQSTIPATFPSPITTVASPLSSNSGNLERVERWECGPTHPRVFHPTVSNGRGAIVHQGHGYHIGAQGFAELINELLDGGFVVVAVVIQGGPDEVTSGDPDDYSQATPYADFFRPLALSVNQLESDGVTDFVMAGLSGGAARTTQYSALDSRVSASVDVSGGWPLYFDLPGFDRRPFNLPAQHGADYTDYYLLAANDGRHVLLRHTDDECCFTLAEYNQYPPFHDEIDLLASVTGGSFELRWVNTSQHAITTEDREIILEEFGVVPAPTAEIVNNSPVVTPLHSSLNTTTLGFWNRWNDRGYGGDLYTHHGQPLGHTATWNFAVESGKTYEIFATWIAHANRATNAPFRVLDSSNEIAFIPVNQELTPTDLQYDGFGWKKLHEYTAATDDLSVALGCDADEYVIADAVLVRELSP